MPDSVGQGDFPRTVGGMMEGGREALSLTESLGKSLHFINIDLFISEKTVLSLIVISNIPFITMPFTWAALNTKVTDVIILLWAGIGLLGGLSAVQKGLP